MKEYVEIPCTGGPADGKEVLLDRIWYEKLKDLRGTIAIINEGAKGWYKIAEGSPPRMVYAEAQ